MRRRLVAGAAGGTGRVDTRANALVIWDEYEPTSGRLLLTCLSLTAEPLAQELSDPDDSTGRGRGPTPRCP